MKLFVGKCFFGLLLPILLLFSSCGKDGSVATTTTAPTTTTTVKTTTTTATTATTTTTTTAETTITSFSVTTTTKSTYKTISGATNTTPSIEADPTLSMPSEENRQFRLYANGEEVLFTFADAEEKPNGYVEWHYTGSAADNLEVTVCVLAEKGCISWITYTFPKEAVVDFLEKDEVQEFVLSELNAMGFATEGSAIGITMLSDKQVVGRYAHVRVTLADGQILFLKVRNFGEEYRLCSFSINPYEDVINPRVFPNWIVK